MISLQKVDNAIKFTFTDSQHYLYGDGVITVPVNSLLLIEDESDFATFKKPDGDVFVSASYSEFGKTKAELLDWYKNNMVGSTGGVDPEDVLDIVDENTNYIDGVDYVSSANTINFYHGEEIVDSIDTSDFVIDGMIDDVRIETISGVTYLVIDFNTASGKEDIQIPLTDIFNPDNYYTKQQVDAALSGKADTSAVTASINAAVSGKVDSSSLATVATSGDYDDLLNKPTIPTVPTSNTAFTNDAGYATSGYVDAAVSGKQDNAVELTQAEYDALVSGGTVDPDTFYIITDATPIDVSNYWTSAQTQSAITAAVTGMVNTSAITSSVTSASTDSEIPTAKAVYDAIPTGGGVNVVQTTGTSTTDVMSQDAVTTQLDNKANKSAAVGGYQFGSDSNGNYLNYRSISRQNIGNPIYYPTINGNYILTSNGTYAKNNYDFQLVETSAITSSVTSASTDSEIPTAKAVYDAIPTGSSITTTSAVTSGSTDVITSGGVYAQLDGLKLKKVTQAEYDALVSGGTIDNNTLYVIS